MRFHHGTIIAPFRAPPGDYWSVSLGKGGRKINRRIHVLVLESHVGPRPSPEMDGCHGLGGKDDNRPANLRWDTKPANMQDFIQTGEHFHGSKSHCKRNHEFTPENMYMNPTSGARQCRQCIRDARGHQKRPA